MKSCLRGALEIIALSFQEMGGGWNLGLCCSKHSLAVVVLPELEAISRKRGHIFTFGLGGSFDIAISLGPCDTTLFPMVGTGRQLTRVGHWRASKALISCRWWINAQWNRVGFDLIKDKSVKFLFDFGDAGQFALPVVIKRSFGSGLKLTAVLTHARGGGVTTVAHARVVAQPAFVQVRMVQCFNNTNPPLRVKCEHLA